MKSEFDVRASKVLAYGVSITFGKLHACTEVCLKVFAYCVKF